MNVDFIKAQVRLLQGASSSERETLIKNIGVCAGVIRPESTWLRSGSTP